MSFTDTLKHEILKIPTGGAEHAVKVDDFILYIHYLMVALFIGWIAFFFWTLIKFRKSANPKADYTGVTSHTSSYIEGVVIVAEAVLLIGFAIPLWAAAVEKFPDEAKALNIRIIGEQFTWNVRYPGADNKFGATSVKFLSATNQFGVDFSDPASKDDFAPAPKDIHVPLGKDVIMRITSKDVIHSFKVVGLRVCQDAIPGMNVPLHFKAIRPGKYMVTCAQLCGNGHATMNAILTVESQEEFDKWAKEKSKGGGATTFE